jgi:hypothetical protein
MIVISVDGIESNFSGEINVVKPEYSDEFINRSITLNIFLVFIILAIPLVNFTEIDFM